jgi:hypothetical protein
MSKQERERIKYADPKLELAESSQKLAGGYDQITKLFPKYGSQFQSLAPKRKEVDRNSFLGDNKYASQREDLKEFLTIVADLFESHESVDEMQADAGLQANQAHDTFNENLLKALEQTSQLEQTYRSIDLFYKNSGEEKVENVTFLNATMKQLFDDDEFTSAISLELKDKFDRLRLNDSYSMLVVPGYVEEKANLDKLAKIAYDYRVMLVTDFKDVETFEELKSEAATVNFQGLDVELSNVLMACNWLALRGPAKDAGEEQPLYGPPSLALAGMIYQQLISQVAAGVKNGKVKGALGVHIDKYFSETQQLEEMGLVPMLYDQNEIIAWSARTLHKSADKGKMTYSVVRVFDWIAKVLITYLNQVVFSNISQTQIEAVEKQLGTFFKKLKEEKVIKNYKTPAIIQTGEDKVAINIEIEPFFPARTFVVNLENYADGDADRFKSTLKQD